MVKNHQNYASLDDLVHYHALKKSGKQMVGSSSFGSFVEAKRNGKIGEYDIETDPLMKKYTMI